MKPLKAANSTLHEFAESTTIHGIAYVFDRAIKGLDNILWLLVVCFGAGVAVYMSLDAWNTWKDAPVLTSVSSTGLPLRNIEFPAITICSQGLIQVMFFYYKLKQKYLFLCQHSLTSILDEWSDPQCQSSHTSQAGSGTGSRGSV